MRSITGKIVATRHAGTSHVGNPSYDVAVSTGAHVTILTTAPNTGLAYGIEGALYRESVHTFHLNKRGKITHATRN